MVEGTDALRNEDMVAYMWGDVNRKEQLVNFVMLCYIINNDSKSELS